MNYNIVYTVGAIRDYIGRADTSFDFETAPMMLGAMSQGGAGRAQGAHRRYQPLCRGEQRHIYPVGTQGENAST